MAENTRVKEEELRQREYSLHELKLARSQELHDLCIIAAGVSRTLRVEPETGKKRLLNGLEVAERCASIYHHLKKKAEGGL